MRFTKRQLLDQIGFTAEETKIILTFQDKLPILADMDCNIEDFCVNARDLWEQLQVGKQFSHWIKNNLDGYTENIDFRTFSPLGLKIVKGRPSTDYMLTLDVAKEIAMYTGKASRASIELQENSRLTRQYFILMEKAVKMHIDWNSIRTPMKKGYVDMKDALNKYMLRTVQREADSWDYAIEADSLDIIATGFKARELRAYIGCHDDITRDSLTAKYNKYLDKLQEWNVMLLNMDKNRYERYSTLLQFFNATFPDAKPIVEDIEVSKILENKAKLLEETKKKVYNL